MISLKQFTEDLVRLLSKALEGECKVKSERLEEYHGRTPYRILFLKDSDGEQAADLNFNENNLIAALGHSSIVTTKKHYIKVYKNWIRLEKM